MVDENAPGLAEALMEAAKAGHVLSARLLFELAELGVDIEEALKKRPLKTIAMRLGAEPQLPSGYPDVEEQKDPSRPALSSS